MSDGTSDKKADGTSDATSSATADGGANGGADERAARVDAGPAHIPSKQVLAARVPEERKGGTALAFLGTLAKALAAIVLGLVTLSITGAMLVGGLVILTCSK